MAEWPAGAAPCTFPPLSKKPYAKLTLNYVIKILTPAWAQAGPYLLKVLAPFRSRTPFTVGDFILAAGATTAA